MPKSLLEQLPEIVANGRKEAERILENLESRHRVGLQTREVVLPAKDSAAHDWVTAQNRQAQQVSADDAWTNRLIYGDNLLANGPPWHYVLLAENVVLEWQAKGARLAELLDYARLRPLADASTQARLL